MAKQSFADIYSQWESTHDEAKALSKRAKDDRPNHGKEPSKNEIRRMNIQDEIDLHQMRLDDAVKAASEFLEESRRRGLRKVRIVTGKGIHSENGEAVIRPAVLALCKESPHIREVSVPKAAEGGSGALSIILKAGKPE